MENKILDSLFNKNVNINKDDFLNLYYSYDDISFIGIDLNILNKFKTYNDYEILVERYTKLMENHNEYKYILKLDDKKIFIRIVSDYNDLVYDIIIYSINNEDDYNKYKRIFFPDVLSLSDDIKKMGYPVLYVDDKINLIYNEKKFTLRIGYEDWDYKNKCLNNLCNSIIDLNPSNDFNKMDFKKEYTFIKNGGEKVKLNLEFRYVDGFYLIIN